MSAGRGLQPVEYRERIGGGRSALLIALGVAVVLGGFVGIAILGREPAPPPVAQAPGTPIQTPVATAATPTAKPPATALPTPAPVEEVTAIAPEASGPSASLDELAAVLEIAGGAHFARLVQIEPGTWQAAYRIPYPRPALEAAIVLTQPERPSLGRWPISLERLTPEWQRSEVVLRVNEPPSDLLAVHDLARNGYTVSVLAASQLYYGVLTIDIRRAQQVALAGSYAVDVRAGRFSARIDLARAASGLYSGTFSIPERLRVDVLRLTVVEIADGGGGADEVDVHQYATEVPPLGNFVAGRMLLEAHMPSVARPRAAELLGYVHDFSVETAVTDDGPALVVQLRVFPPDERADQASALSR